MHGRQWDASSQAGFTSGTPWMRINDDYADPWNVEAQVKDEGSVLSFWKRALATRKEYEVLVSDILSCILPLIIWFIDIW